MTTNNWFECVTQHITEDEVTAKPTKHKQTYLVDAMSFTEAEARILEKLKDYAQMDFSIKKLAPVKIEEVIDDQESNKWFKAKIVFIHVDDKGKTKKNPIISLVRATDMEAACINVNERMKNTVVEWFLGEIKEYDLFDYFPYFDPRM